MDGGGGAGWRGSEWAEGKAAWAAAAGGVLRSSYEFSVVSSLLSVLAIRRSCILPCMLGEWLLLRND